MKVEGNWVSEDGVQAIFAMLNAASHQAYFVGGCVRNSLLKEPINDIDIATDATPSQVLDLAKSVGTRAVETGIEHGTITLVVAKKTYEVTTFRRDVETDGRRAVVAFSTDIREDALRRDFTMNALYADHTGEILDPLHGLPDLEARHVRFIEDADQRIKEDYLRILRFFRFYAWYGDPKNGIDPDGLAACSSNLAGLETLANERIGAEMLKLLAAVDPAPAISAMAQSGVLGALISGADAKQIAVMVHLEGENDLKANALGRLCLLGGQEVSAALRLSKKDDKTLATFKEEAGSIRGPAELGYLHGEQLAADIILLRCALFETPLPKDTVVNARRGARQTFEVKAADLMPELSGPSLGRALKKLEQEWISSDFQLTKAALLKRTGET